MIRHAPDAFAGVWRMRDDVGAESSAPTSFLLALSRLRADATGDGLQFPLLVTA